MHTPITAGIFRSEFPPLKLRDISQLRQILHPHPTSGISKNLPLWGQSTDNFWKELIFLFNGNMLLLVHTYMAYIW